MSYCKYKRKRKQYKLGDNWYDYSPQIYEKGEIIQCGLSECTSSPPQEPITPVDPPLTYERWITVPNDYMCVNYNKYYKLMKQTSTNNIDWVDTNHFKQGELIEAYSSDCDYNTYTWEVVPNEYICE